MLIAIEKDTIRTRKHDGASDHFTKYTTNGPNIHVFRVAHAKNDLWCSVIPRYDVRRHCEGRTSCPCKTKI